jgi:hypothetical protein
MKLRLIEVVEQKGNLVMMTIDFVPGWFLNLLGFGVKTRRYLGVSTVWYEYPSWKRQGTLMEGTLCEFYEGWRFRNG